VREEKEKKLRIQLKPIVAKSDDFRKKKNSLRQIWHSPGGTSF
jgi:hypothetical protein